VSYDWTCLEADYAGLQRPQRITLLTVHGTAVSMWDGPPADTARALGDEQFYWQPIDYPAATFPMLPSRRAGEAELARQVRLHPGKIALAGYSQGALIVDAVWLRIWDPNGDLHDRLKDVVGVCTWGDPMRCPGIARGNEFSGQPLPQLLDGQVTGGIAGPDCLTPEQTPTYFLSWALDGDLYAAAPTGADPHNGNEADVGKVEKLIYDVVQEVTFPDIMAVAEEIIKVIFMPFVYLIPLIQAVINAGLFFAAGMAAPHYHYSTDGAVKFLQQTATTALAA